jgi:hypothetical protein
MKQLKMTALGFAAVLLLLVLAVGALYWTAHRGDAAAEFVGVTVAPGSLHIGDTVHLDVTVELPWHRRPTGRNLIHVPEGLQILNSDEQNVTHIGFRTWQWTTRFDLQAYDFGPFKNLETELYVTPRRDKSGDVVITAIPELKIVPRLQGDTNAGLNMGGELRKSFLAKAGSKWWLILIALIVVVLIIAFAVRLAKRTIMAPPPPAKPWVVAEKAMCRLAEQIEQGLEAETFFVALTDIIRVYVEKAYKMPASEQTTPEFLQTINRQDSRLSTDHRLLLVDFLTAADMVKFARADANQEQITDALKHARQFVVETSEDVMKRIAESPKEQGRKNGQSKAMDGPGTS